MASAGREAVYIAFGGNIEPLRHIPAAVERLARVCRITAVSPFYWTPAIGRPEQAEYLNGVCRIETHHDPAALKFDVLRPIEAQMGRVRTNDRYASRPIDLDILLYGTRTLDVPGLRVPDPDLCERLFLARAVLALDPGLRVPGTGELLADAAARLAPVPMREELGLAGVFQRYLT